MSSEMRGGFWIDAEYGKKRNCHEYVFGTFSVHCTRTCPKAKAARTVESWDQFSLYMIIGLKAA